MTQKIDHEPTLSDANDQVLVRLEKLKRSFERGDNPYKNGLTPTLLAREIHSKYESKTKEELEPMAVTGSVAGRVMAIRDFGKASFVRVQDRTGLNQIFVQKKSLGDTGFERFKELDIGDVIWAEGKLFRTKTGELTIDVSKIEFVAKSLRPLPEKFHGISDIELRYRHRYLDLIMNEASRNVFLARSKIVDVIRKFFTAREYLEVETPMMHPIAGGAAARPFKTHHNTLDTDLFLRIAPELYLKRLVVGGFERVFEINRNFRNEGISIKHNPEFTMLEFYQAWATYEDLMPLTEDLLREVARAVHGKEQVTYQDVLIDFAPKFSAISVEDAIMKFARIGSEISASKLRDKKTLMEYGKKHKLPMTPKMSTGELLMAIFDEEVESKLIQPTFVTHYPLDVSPLSRKNEKDPFVVDRFELFIFGREMANAFSELNDPIDQRERFESQALAKKGGNEEAHDVDHDYIRALEHAMPPAAGEGVGIDRLVMLMTDSASIRDVILFPQLRPES